MRTRSSDAGEASGSTHGSRAIGSSGGWTSLADLAYQELLGAIVEGRLPPGLRLVPEALGRELGISPTPVKAALNRLVWQGIVTDLPRRGMYVAELTIEELLGLFEARRVLEMAAARDYFDRVTPRFLDQLAQTAEAYEQLVAEQGERLRRHTRSVDHEFHRLIVSLTGSAHVMRWYEQTNMHIQAYRAADPAGRYAATIREHRAIVAGFRSGDPEQAVAAIRLHIQNAQTYYEGVLRQITAEQPRLRPIATRFARRG